ncbi:MAG: hypothetical protein P8186_02655 [Anaerolineae bacterium]|jgi:hypothetical protein
MKHLNLPAAAIPTDAPIRLFEGGHGRVGEQQPLDRFVDVGGWVFLPDQDCVERDSRQLQSAGTPGRPQADAGEAHRHRGLTLRALVVAGKVNREVASDGLAFDLRPQLTPFRIQQGSVRRSSHQQGSLPFLGEGKQLIDVGFAVADGDDFHPSGGQSQGLLERLLPAVAFLVLDRQPATFLRSMRRFLLGADKHGLVQYPKGYASRRDDQRGMQPTTALFLAFLPNRTQTLSLGMRGIIEEETGEEGILMKDKQGRVIGFEKLNFATTETEPLQVAFEAMAV